MAEATPLVYKGHPLRRVNNLIYYGSMSEKYIIFMQILSTEKVGDLEQANKISVQLQLTDPNVKSNERIVKESTKNSLFEAIDIGSIWLDRALAGKM